jgi:hypothetical protein
LVPAQGEGRGYNLAKLRITAELTGELVYEFVQLCSAEPSKAASALHNWRLPVDCWANFK